MGVPIFRVSYENPHCDDDPQTDMTDFMTMMLILRRRGDLEGVAANSGH